jgi:hypothetical protein
VETGRGFNKRQNSEIHIWVMANWKEKEYRQNRGQRVKNLIK